MKIGLDARLWNETGVGRYIRNFVRELQVLDKANEYVLFMLSKDIKNGKWQMGNGKWKIVPADIRWHSVEEQLRFPKILHTENLDLVHFPYFSIPVNYKRPFVITIHDLILNHFPTGKASTLPYPLYQIKRLGYKYVLDQAIKNSKKIIVPLNAVKYDLVKTMNVPGDKIVVTYEGVDENVLSRNEKNTKYIIHNTRYFLYVGNAYPHKNLDRLIKAFLQVTGDKRQVTRNLKLILVGKDDYFYRKLSQTLDKEKVSGVEILNHVNDEDLANLYNNAVALVAPSLMEGFGLPVLEALSNKCLVAASDIPAFREVADEAAVYFDPYSVDDIKNKLTDILEMKNYVKEKFIKKGLESAGKYSWKKMAQNTLDVYESCVSL